MEPQFEKNNGEEGENSLFLKSYSELSKAQTLYTISVLEVAWINLDLSDSIRPPFKVKVSVYKYPENHNWWCDFHNFHNCMICMLGFFHNNSDYVLDCWEGLLLPSVTVCAGVGDVATFNTLMTWHSNRLRDLRKSRWWSGRR